MDFRSHLSNTKVEQNIPFPKCYCTWRDTLLFQNVRYITENGMSYSTCFYIHNLVHVLGEITLHRICNSPFRCFSASHTTPLIVVVVADLPSVHVMMEFFRINNVFKLLELLPFKGIFMRWKNSLSIISFK